MVDPKMITVLVNIPPPKIVKEVRRFLGLICYYRKFLKNYVALVFPINELIKRN